MVKHDPTSRLGCVALALALAVALAPHEATAKKRKKGKKPVAALFLSAKGNPDSKLYAALLKELTKTAMSSKPIKVLFGKHLRKAIRTNPSKAIGKCGSNVTCIAKLGQKARSEVVVFGRVSAEEESGIKVQILVVDVAGATITERMALSLSSTDDIATQVAAKLDSLYPVGTATASADEIPLDMILGGDEETTEVADASTETSDTAELPLDEAVEAPADTTLAAAESDATQEEDALALEAVPPPPETISAVDPNLAATSSEETSSGDSRVLTYTGIAIAGLGVGALGAGGYFGMSATSKRDSIVYGSSGTTQIEAERLQNDANKQADMANIMFGVGGGLMGVGALLVVLDLFVLDGGSPETSVTVGSEVAAATFTWRF